MIEKKAIRRLEKIVDRLNSVLEKNLLTEYRSKKDNMSKQELIEFLCSIEHTLSNFAVARDAKQTMEYAKTKNGTIVAQDKYILCAMLVAEVLQSLSWIDTTRVLCEIKIETQLKERLEAVGKPATELLKFMNDSPVECWSYSDHFSHRGIKEFKLVRSRADIAGLLGSGFKDITGYELAGIRIFYKRNAISVHTHFQREEIMKKLQIELPEKAKKEFFYSGLDILYPDSEFHGIYYIYVPENL